MTSIVRPVPGIVRKAMMDMFRIEICGGTIGDFFAGSGSFGIEALSNDADKVIFFEKNLSVINVLKYNLSKLKLENNFYIVKMDLLEDMKGLSIYNFAVSFLSPPFMLYKEEVSLKKLLKLFDLVSSISNISILQFPKQVTQYLVCNDRFSHGVQQYVKSYGDNNVFIRRKVV